MAAFDSSFLMLMLDPSAPAPFDPSTNKPVSDVELRINYLIQRIEQDSGKIIIPTPALSEILVRADAAGPDYLSLITKHSCFEISSFDIRSAVEVAAITRRAIDTGDKKGGSSEPWQKVKYDRQIVGIAKVNRAGTIYSDDLGIRYFAAQAGIDVIGISELPLPPEDAQQSLDL